jgi:hypothetical protein
MQASWRMWGSSEPHCTLQRAHLPAAVHGMVPEARHVLRHQLHKPHCRVLRCCHKVGRLAIKVLQQGLPHLKDTSVA